MDKVMAKLKICAHLEICYLDKIGISISETLLEELNALKNVPKTYLLSKGEEKVSLFLEKPIK